MKYEKPALTIEEQIALLKSRNLVIENDAETHISLSNISYYRLSSYLYPYRNHEDVAQSFIFGTNFEDIIKIYSFDRKLRLLIFDSIERIEIAFRTQLTLKCSFSLGVNWYMDRNLFIDKEKFDKISSGLMKEYSNSKEVFIEHFKKKYDDTEYPPSWIGLEIFTFGQLSAHFTNLNSKSEKQKVAEYFNLPLPVFESWFHSIVYVRNICAHHSRLWNRSLGVRPNFPHPKNFNWLQFQDIHNNRIYYFLCTLQFLLDTVHPKNTFREKLKALLEHYLLIDITKMGFPKNWLEEKFWVKK